MLSENENPLTTHNVQKSNKPDYFYNSNVYDFYESTHHLPNGERLPRRVEVYNPYDFSTTPIYESLKGDNPTRSWDNFCKKRGFVKPHRSMMKRKLLNDPVHQKEHDDAYLKERDDFFDQLIQRYYLAHKALKPNEPINKKLIEINVSFFTLSFHDELYIFLFCRGDILYYFYTTNN